jgi:PAS domain S-box-containing protein
MFTHSIHELAQQITALQQRSIWLQQQSQLEEDMQEAALEELVTALEELRVAEEELRQQNEELQIAQLTIAAERQRYQDLFEFAPDGYLVTNSDGKIEAANRAAAQLLGVPQRFLVGKPLATFVVPNERSAFRAQLLQIQQGDWLQEWEVRLQPRDNYSLDVALTIAVDRDATGEPKLLRWSLRDVTRRKQAEQQVYALNAQLKERSTSEETLRHIAEKVSASLDEHQVLQTAVNEIAQALNLWCCDVGVYDLQAKTAAVHYHYTQPEVAQSPSCQSKTIALAEFAEGYSQLLRGQSLQFCERTDHPIRSRAAILACPITTPEAVLGDFWCFKPRGATFSEHEVYLVQQVARQCAIALQQARLYQAARMQVMELAALNRLKQDFLSTVSHELRTPLTNMKMALRLLEVTTNEAQRARCLEIIQTQCDREIDLVTDLLDLQELETGSFAACLPESIRLQDWILTLIGALQTRMQVRQQILTLQIPDALPAVITDKALLRRSLLELLHNAHKYTPVGGEIIIEAKQDCGTSATLLSVRNSTEIPAADLPYIFDKFYRVPQTDPWQTSGTGLGLSLVKQFVDHLQGTIDVVSQDGWTTFTLRLPDRLQRTAHQPRA